MKRAWPFVPLSVVGMFGAIAAVVAVVGGLAAAWLTHVIVCIQDDRWGFLIAGAIVPPIAVVHGVGVWLGAW